MDTRQALELASRHLRQLPGKEFEVLTIAKPQSLDAAVNLAKVVSKLSPLLGNLIEFNTVEYLNEVPEFAGLEGTWRRRDPGFPDTVFDGAISPTPGFEIKAWFPLATEITARFKDSQNHFTEGATWVAMLAWLPSELFFGTPRLVGCCIVSGQSVAAARDLHYHSPPDYLVLEPEDTSSRTINLQQTNTNGYKFQGTSAERAEAVRMVASFGPDGRTYSPSRDYQVRLRDLMGSFTYRLDTNFAKMDRIQHPEIERFKRQVMGTTMAGATIQQWAKLLTAVNKEMRDRETSGDPTAGPAESRLRRELRSRFGFEE